MKEESEEEERSREISRDQERQDDHSLEPDEDEEEISDENISRPAGNTGPSDSQRSNGPSAISQSSGPGRPYQSASPVPTGRGAPQQTPPFQYRTTPKPTKPRKQPIVEESPFRDQIRGPPKPSKPTQIYDSRGKKPVAQVSTR